MTALTQDRNSPEAVGDVRHGLLGANQSVFGGAIVMRNAAGNLVAGAAATGAVGAGRSEERAASVAADEVTLKYKVGTFRYANSAAADELNATHVGKVCFIADDQTVAATDGGSTRSPAGIVDHVDQNGVWVRFDEALTVALNA